LGDYGADTVKPAAERMRAMRARRAKASAARRRALGDALIDAGNALYCLAPAGHAACDRWARELKAFEFPGGR